MPSVFPSIPAWLGATSTTPPVSAIVLFAVVTIAGCVVSFLTRSSSQEEHRDASTLRTPPTARPAARPTARSVPPRSVPPRSTDPNAEEVHGKPVTRAHADADARAVADGDSASHYLVDDRGDEDVRGLAVVPRLPQELEPRERTIVLCLPAYREPNLEHTLASAFREASYPMRLRPAVVEQLAPGDTPAALKFLELGANRPLADLFRFPAPGKPDISHTRARGGAFARAATLKHMVHPEEDGYVLITCPDTVFGAGWDEMLIADLESRPRPDRTILTCFPPMFRAADVPERAEATPPLAVAIHRLREDGVPIFAPDAAGLSGQTRNQGWTPDFSFARASLHARVPYPSLELLDVDSERALMFARLFTRGADVATPHVVPVACAVSHDDEWASAWQHMGEKSFQELRDKALAFTRSVLYDGLVSRRGLGTVRSAATMHAHQGIDPATMSLIVQRQPAVSDNRGTPEAPPAPVRPAVKARIAAAGLSVNNMAGVSAAGVGAARIRDPFEGIA